MPDPVLPIDNLGLLPRLHDDGGDAVVLIDNPDLALPAWTLASLEARTEALARDLHQRGVAENARVAIIADNSAAYVAAVLAVARTGAVAVPLNPRLTAEAIAGLLQRSGAVGAFADAMHAHLVPEWLPRLDLGARPVANKPVEWPPGGDHAAIQLYTSGSTGRPKAVVLSHRALLWHLADTRASGLLGSSLRTVVAAPMFHMNGLTSTMLAVAARGTAGLLDRFEAGRYLRAAAAVEATVLIGVPTMYAMLLDEVELLEQLDLSSVRLVASGSAPLSDDLLRRIEAAFPQAVVRNNYGTTEAFNIFGDHPDGVPRPVMVRR